MYRKSKGFSLAEILIVFLIITMVILASASFFKRKHRSISSKTQKHGTYACTVFDGEEYYFASSTKNAAIPVDKSGWVQGKCGTAFFMPTTGAMNVTLIGAGGDGDKATFKENSVDKDFYLALDDGNFKDVDYTVPATGWYKIKILGDKATVSRAVSPPGCIIGISNPGNAAKYEMRLKLNENDIIKLDYRGKNTSSCYPDDMKSVEFDCGSDGGDIRIFKNNQPTAIIEVYGAKASYYSSFDHCYVQPNTGDDGRVVSNSVELTTSDGVELISSIDDTVDPYVSIKWDEYFKPSITTYTPIPGLGGEAGSLKSFLYPVLRKDLPKITIGKNNVTNVKDRTTVFGDVTARGGKDKAISCTRGEDNKYDGCDGQKFTDDSIVTTIQGTGGKAPNYDGTNAAGFASGGGGGGVNCEDKNHPTKTTCRYGEGGKGANGILIITY